MDSKKELRIAYSLAVILLIVGVLSYTAFSAKAPEEPVRIMFKSQAQDVLFQHKVHTTPTGYGAACYDCHHHPEDDETAIRACGDCHGKDEKIEPVLQTCTECHDADEFEDYEIVNRTDAFHGQCIGCHTEFEVEPTECEGCHMM